MTVVLVWRCFLVRLLTVAACRCGIFLLLLFVVLPAPDCWGDSQVIQLAPLGNVGLKAAKSGDLTLVIAGIETLATDWEMVEYAPKVYHLKQRSWDFFLELDLAQVFIFRVPRGQIGSPPGEKIPVTTMRLIVSQGANSMPMPGGPKPAGMPPVDESVLFNLYFPQTVFILDWHHKTCSVQSADILISAPDNWDFWPATETICQFRGRHVPDYAAKTFYEYNEANALRLEICRETPFGVRVPSQKRPTISVKVVKADIIPGPPAQPGPGSMPAVAVKAPVVVAPKGKSSAGSVDQTRSISGDLAVEQYPVKAEPSRWLEAERQRYRELLQTGTYDVLVVPFQVSGYAIDRPGRSLMTRYLSRELHRATQWKIPDPTLVAKALGEQNRTFDPKQVYALANTLKVRKIVWCYAGHEQDLQLDVHFVVQQREGKGPLREQSPQQIVERFDIPFSDSLPPSQALLPVLGELTAEMGFRPADKKLQQQRTLKSSGPAFPADLATILKSHDAPAIDRAAYLQLLAILCPSTIEAQGFYERSLVLLEDVPADMAGRNLLRARALLNLGRRPAAVAALREAHTPAEQAFRAYLDGNSDPSRTWAEKIENPVYRTLAELESASLANSYGIRESFIGRFPAAVRVLPEWDALIRWRLDLFDAWHVDDNLTVKELLDRHFPIKGFSLKELAYANMVVGRGEYPEMLDTAATEHVRKVLNAAAPVLLANGDSGPVPLDLLRLFDSIGLANIAQGINIGFWRGNPQEVLDDVDRYKPLFDQHPLMEWYRSHALRRLSGEHGGKKSSLYQEAQQRFEALCAWEQGQTSFSVTACGNVTRTYDFDFPRRSDWIFMAAWDSPSDRIFDNPQELIRNGEYKVTPNDRRYLFDQRIALDYTQTGFSELKKYHQALKRMHYDKEADEVVEQYRSRFQGIPAREAFYAELARKNGHVGAVADVYEEAVLRQPMQWSGYKNLFYEKIRQGDLDGAVRAAWRYQPFTMAPEERQKLKIGNVDLSNQAYHIGQFLFAGGFIDQARPFLELSAGYETGSAAEYISREFLARVDQDFMQAAALSLRRAERYNDADAYANYMSYLKLMGEDQAAWAVLDTLRKSPGGQGYLYPVLLAQQMDNLTAQQQFDWLLSQKFDQDVVKEVALRQAVNIYAIDRPVSMAMVEPFDRLENWFWETFKLPPYLVLDQGANRLGGVFSITNKTYPAGTVSACKTLSQAYALIRTDQLGKAFKVIDSTFLQLPVDQDDYSFMLPYGAWAASKSGQSRVMQSYLDRRSKELAPDFDDYLARAFLLGGRGTHAEAVKCLQLAWFNIFSAKGNRLVPAKFQFLEACTWLYESTLHDAYKQLLLEKARSLQALAPEISWGYSMALAYAESEPERLKCLALTLYLDPQSMRLAGVSDKDKKRARDWFKDNNPFDRRRGTHEGNADNVKL